MAPDLEVVMGFVGGLEVREDGGIMRPPAGKVDGDDDEVAKLMTSTSTTSIGCAMDLAVPSSAASTSGCPRSGCNELVHEKSDAGELSVPVTAGGDGRRSSSSYYLPSSCRR
jgi:hypothetical protein